jgi:hypothetical protein
VASLKPVLNRPNLAVHTHAQAIRVTFEGARATGVLYAKDSQTRQARAEREVIRCGGAIGSPQLLLLSGVGPAGQLRALGERGVLINTSRGPIVEEAALVVTATGSPDYVFEKSAPADAGETFVVDIAQPRDVPPTVTELPNATVRDLDALQTVTDENRAQRAEAASAVEEMIDVEFEHLLAQYKRKRADRVISAMYAGAERIKGAELDRALGQLDLDDEDAAVVEAMADSIVGQLLAPPTDSLRDAAEADDWSTIQTAIRLFDPSDIDAEAFPDPSASGESGMPEAVRERIQD